MYGFVATNAYRISVNVDFYTFDVRPSVVAVTPFVLREHFEVRQVWSRRCRLRGQRVLARALEVYHFAVKRPIVRIPRRKARGNLCATEKQPSWCRVSPIMADTWQTGVSTHWRAAPTLPEVPFRWSPSGGPLPVVPFR